MQLALFNEQSRFEQNFREVGMNLRSKNIAESLGKKDIDSTLKLEYQSL